MGFSARKIVFIWFWRGGGGTPWFPRLNGPQPKIGNHVLYHQGVVPKEIGLLCSKKDNYIWAWGCPLGFCSYSRQSKIRNQMLYQQGVFPQKWVFSARKIWFHTSQGGLPPLVPAPIVAIQKIGSHMLYHQVVVPKKKVFSARQNWFHMSLGMPLAPAPMVAN